MVGTWRNGGSNIRLSVEPTKYEVKPLESPELVLFDQDSDHANRSHKIILMLMSSRNLISSRISIASQSHLKIAPKVFSKKQNGLIA